MTQFVDKIYRLAPGVKIRREVFGGILYHHLTGRVTFIYSPQVVTILEQQEEKTVAEVLGKQIFQQSKFNQLEKNDPIWLGQIFRILNKLKAEGLINES